MSKDEMFMHRCLQLAELGRGNVAPNPMVGSVIVHNGKIIGEGYHQKCGEAHAEVNAVNSVLDKSLLSESTIYVSLEPCAHFGKTPPCSDLIVKHNFKRVVVGCLDTFSEVSGKGIERMRKAGIQVDMSSLETECRAINQHFFTFHEKKRPYIILKWAQTPNGFIDAGDENTGEVTWISNKETQVKTHLLRSYLHGILVGKNTVISDNPSLTVRAVSGNNPIRIVLDSNLELYRDFSVFNNEAETIVLNTKSDFQDGNIKGIQMDQMNVAWILEALHKKNIQSILVEGGRKTLNSFIEANTWDEALVIVGQNEFSSGTSAPTIDKVPSSSEDFFGDQLFYYHNR